MTEYTAVTDWTTIERGQKVRATRDGEHLEFTVNTKATASGVTLRSSQSIVQICTYDRPEWVLEVEKPAVVLPTEDGFYSVSKTGMPLYRIVRHSHGEWIELGGTESNETGSQLATRFAKQGELTRLRPEAEVAAEVLAVVDAGIRGTSGDWSLAITRARVEFGVGA